MLELIKIGPDEVVSLQEVCRETYYDTFGAVNREEDIQAYMDDAYSRDVLVAELENPESEVYFLKDEMEIAGYLKLNTGAAQTEYVADNTLEIQRIYVRANRKRRGYGSRLMAFSLERAREKECQSVWLGVWEPNQSALAFYKSHGFRHVGEHHFQMGDTVDTDYIYLKDL